MVGSDEFPFGFRPIFRDYVTMLVSGRVPLVWPPPCNSDHQDYYLGSRIPINLHFPPVTGRGPYPSDTLLGTNISPPKVHLKMILLFQWWDMLVPWSVPSQKTKKVRHLKKGHSKGQVVFKPPGQIIPSLKLT